MILRRGIWLAPRGVRECRYIFSNDIVPRTNVRWLSEVNKNNSSSNETIRSALFIPGQSVIHEFHKTYIWYKMLSSPINNHVKALGTGQWPCFIGWVEGGKNRIKEKKIKGGGGRRCPPGGQGGHFLSKNCQNSLNTWKSPYKLIL